jgi:hypothetical protein
MKHNHPFFIGERVWDDDNKEWANVVRVGGELPEEGGDLILLEAPDGRGMTWLTDTASVYQIAEGLRTVNTGDLVCYEHNETEDNYPYYCPFLEENFFSFEVEGTPCDNDFTEGSAYELVQKLQDAILSVPADKSALTCPVFVEDENGRLENITHIWYDKTRHMIRLTVGGVEFTDSKEE